MENYNEHYEDPFEENKRPGFLTFLCILTFIGSGYWLLFNLFVPAYISTMLKVLHNTPSFSSPAFAAGIQTFEQIAVTPVWQFYLLAFFCATSILGAIYMLKMKKIGFHIYVVSQLAQMCIGQFIIAGFFKPNFSSMLFTLLFIGLYGIYYKKFTALNAENDE
ncbi:MAG: hypothetical protein FWC34_05545 [Bacteroidetes bacterium]|nr:hypothetical protein [Bacteroidota bacterium]MCL2303110.1 hypothetical protein [Lentimicrobiaceae bacterium]